MIDYKEAGNKIRLQRKTLGLTQEIVSEKVGITPSFLSQVESGTRKAGIKTFLSISKALSISLDYILGNEIAEQSENDFDELDAQIFHHLEALQPRDKRLVLDIIICMQKEYMRGEYAI